MRHTIAIRGGEIRLGQLLKLAGVVDSGSEVKTLLGERGALVNGEPENRRGRQLRAGDVVQVGDHELELVAAGEQPGAS
jgi:ribosome-associated protein